MSARPQESLTKWMGISSLFMALQKTRPKRASPYLRKKIQLPNNNVMKISYIMKAYIKVLIITLVASVCIGCKSKIDVAVDEQLSEIDSNVEIDANDVAWATGWTIYKWKLGALTSEPVHAIHLVVIGSDGEVKHESEIRKIPIHDESSA